MSECTHNCSTCGENCSSRNAPQSFLEPVNSLSTVGKVYAVVSVNNAGTAVLTGLADNNGVLLVKGLIPAVSHTP